MASLRGCLIRAAMGGCAEDPRDAGRRQHSRPRLVCSYREWSYGGAEAAPATATHRYLQPCLPTMVDWVALGTIGATDDGAIAIRGVHWRLATVPPRLSLLSAAQQAWQRRERWEHHVLDKATSVADHSRVRKR